MTTPKYSASDMAQKFVAAVLEESPPSQDQLIFLLDELAITYHHSPLGNSSDKNIEFERPDEKQLRQRLIERFPDFSVYGSPGVWSFPPDGIGMEDSIDDLIDILIQMKETIWRNEHIGVDNANWYFKNMFFHWGAHLRSLSLYLHARKFTIN